MVDAAGIDFGYGGEQHLLTPLRKTRDWYVGLTNAEFRGFARSLWIRPIFRNWRRKAASLVRQFAASPGGKGEKALKKGGIRTIYAAITPRSDARRPLSKRISIFFLETPGGRRRSAVCVSCQSNLVNHGRGRVEQSEGSHGGVHRLPRHVRRRLRGHVRGRSGSTPQCRAEGQEVPDLPRVVPERLGG
jgi:hypothetical protein